MEPTVLLSICCCFFCLLLTPLDRFARDSKLLDRLFQDLADAATAVSENHVLGGVMIMVLRS